MIHLPEQAAARDRRSARGGIDADGAEARQVDLHAAVARGLSRETVAPALDREQQAAMVAREVHRHADIRDTGRLHHQRRVLVEARFQDAASLVIPVLAGQQQSAAQRAAQVRERTTAQRHPCAIARHGLDVLGVERRVPERGGKGVAARQHADRGGNDGGSNEFASSQGKPRLSGGGRVRPTTIQDDDVPATGQW